MITRTLHDSGLHLIGSGAEELIDAAEDNPEGFWENKAIVACTRTPTPSAWRSGSATTPPSSSCSPADRRIVTHYDTFFIDPEGEIGRLCHARTIYLRLSRSHAWADAFIEALTRIRRLPAFA